MSRGIVLRFNPIKGWGFISDETIAEDVMVHQSQIVAPGWRLLRAGQEVTYDIEKCERGYRAKNVRVVKREVAA